MIEPLDYVILDKLPEEDTNVGLYQIGDTIKALRKKLGEDNISTGSLSARVRLLNMTGLVRSVRMVGTSGSAAYQTTVRGKEVLDRWKAQQ